MRTSRIKPTPHARPIAIQDRDERILSLAAVAGYVTTEQVECALFDGSTAGRKRLRKLLNHGYLSVAIADSRFPSLWSATRRALVYLEEIHGGPIPGARTSGVIRPDGITHHVASVDCRLAVIAMRNSGLLDLAAYHGGRSAAAQAIGFPRFHLVPDGLAELCGAGPRFLAIELDMGTEARASVLRKKLEAYAVLLHSRPQRDLELWLVDARPAANGLEAICRSIGLSFNVRCFRLPELNQRPVAAPVPTLDGREWHCTSNDAAQPRAENTNNQRVARGRSAAAGTVAATAARTSVQVREVHAGLGGDESA